RALSGTGLFFPPDPSSGEYASLGGMTATNASGAHAVKYGSVRDYLLDAEVVLSSGEVITLSALSATPVSALPFPFSRIADVYLMHRDLIESAYPPVRHNVAGYNLRGLVKDEKLLLQGLFSGAEGTLGIATRLVFRLLDKPGYDSLVVAFFDSIQKSAQAVRMILPLNPAGIEVMDRSLLEMAREVDLILKNRIPSGIDNVLLVEFDGSTPEETRKAGETVLSQLKENHLCRSAYLAISEAEKARFWAIRKAAVPILYKLRGKKKILALVEDAAIPTDRLVDYFKGLYALFDTYQVRFVLYGHIAKGLLHTRPLLDLTDPADIRMLKILADGVFDLVHRLGGVVSGEHGDGRLRSTYIQRQYPEIFPLFQAIRNLLDPFCLMNPDIKTASAPDQMRHHLRYGLHYHRTDTGPSLLFQPGGFPDAVEACHGCTTCTTLTPVTRMCPVYKVTRKEEAAPKAKANLLRAIISGKMGPAALYTQAVQDVMRLCLGCGSCRQECPSNVDIPKLVMEAKARCVRRFGPSLRSRTLTRAETAGRYGGYFSGITTPLMNMDTVRQAGQCFLGINRHAPFPVPARNSLFHRVLPVTGSGNVQVLYFSGCYAGYYRPEIGEALTGVLTRMGYTVHTPNQHCCGLPLLSNGMVDAARKKIRKNLAAWRNLLAVVDHVVVTCSSCGLALREKWGSVLDLPLSHQIQKKIIHFSALLQHTAPFSNMAPVNQTALYHLPCHLKIQPHAHDTRQLLAAIPGLLVSDLPNTCCGMAGTWGMAAENTKLSRDIGNQWISWEKCAEKTDLIITDCPTCEMQIAHLSGSVVQHPVEMAARSLVLKC
ncbi:FAD-binding protein, partial [Desulfosarcina sp. OttesenSCG-928-G17]|nr:FAD-binding protein [Desulfosarcina sp. OttesenSCG-928-G17]